MNATRKSQQVRIIASRHFDTVSGNTKLDHAYLNPPVWRVYIGMGGGFAIGIGGGFGIGTSGGFRLEQMAGLGCNTQLLILP